MDGGFVAVLLAAGKGTRMRSDLPKVLHPVCGRPMVHHVAACALEAGADHVYPVVGHGAERVVELLKATFPGAPVTAVVQEEQLGTGHAVMQCEQALSGFSGTVVVLNGDVPCLRPQTIRQFSDYHRDEGAAGTVLSARLEDPFGYGRIVRDQDGALVAIVEQKDADETIRRINEINSGLFCFDKEKLFTALGAIGRDNAQNEYYLTDVIAVLKNEGEVVRAYCVDDSFEVAGVNTDAELEAIRRRMGS
jgi:bifunctional UDP-N-acetylglucosamine pyrophosphorylase/glucosamine-1-phosphate N-acetyltransferase